MTKDTHYSNIRRCRKREPIYLSRPINFFNSPFHHSQSSLKKRIYIRSSDLQPFFPINLFDLINFQISRTTSSHCHIILSQYPQFINRSRTSHTLLPPLSPIKLCKRNVLVASDKFILPRYAIHHHLAR